MEKININNFLVIKEANFEVNKFNIIIGPQANGKSILVKLSYFFKKLINTFYMDSLKNSDNIEEIITSGKLLFQNYFPSYIWKDSDFSITYENKQFKITIKNTSSDNNFDLIFCNNFKELKNNIDKDYKDFVSKYEKDADKKMFDFLLISEFQQYFFKRHEKDKCIEEILKNCIFIPASRSYFINLQKNIFSFLSKDIDIDIFIKEFGSYYERSKNIYSQFNIFKKLAKKEYLEKFKYFMDLILKGEFVHKDSKDWIKTGENLISLSDASSGQQESLPMLMVLYTQLLISNENINYIEEPEAHLFPTSQKYIINIISLMYNLNNINFITTHSPYILTAINNLILAYDVQKEKGLEVVEKFKDLTINFDDVSAYTIEDGKLISIKDNESRLIGMNIIDSVSDDFNEEFDQLLQLSI